MIPPPAATSCAPPIREAATVVLVRDSRSSQSRDRVPVSPTGIEVFLQHRVATMEFAAGMSVFPGGGVEPRDRLGREGAEDTTGGCWSGPDAQWFSECFLVPAERAAAAVRAAVRELFEETGVLLASGSGSRPGVQERIAMEKGEKGIEESLASFGLVVDSSALRPFDRWITPTGFSRRYDTLFFLAELPAGVEPDDRTSEARSAEWMCPAAALHAEGDGSLAMLPPTRAIVSELARSQSVAELLSAPRSIPFGGR